MTRSRVLRCLDVSSHVTQIKFHRAREISRVERLPQTSQTIPIDNISRTHLCSFSLQIHPRHTSRITTHSQVDHSISMAEAEGNNLFEESVFAFNINRDLTLEQAKDVSCPATQACC